MVLLDHKTSLFFDLQQKYTWNRCNSTCGPRGRCLQIGDFSFHVNHRVKCEMFTRQDDQQIVTHCVSVCDSLKIFNFTLIKTSSPSQQKHKRRRRRVTSQCEEHLISHTHTHTHTYTHTSLQRTLHWLTLISWRLTLTSPKSLHWPSTHISHLMGPVADQWTSGWGVGRVKLDHNVQGDPKKTIQREECRTDEHLRSSMWKYFGFRRWQSN